MSVLSLRRFLGCAIVAAMPLALLGQSPLQGPPSAILHTQGGVWVNGAEARDSTAIFAGDLIETKPTFSANLTLEGTQVLIAPESIGKFDGEVFQLDHGAVSVGTSKSFKVRVNCLKVVPVLNEWTQYEVSDLNGTVHVAARKLDVNVEHAARGKGAAENTSQSSPEGGVRESQEKNFDESEVCGAAAPASAGSAMNPKWIAAGAAGGALLILILAHGGGGKSSVSPSTP